MKDDPAAVARIAKGLSEIQRRELAGLSEHPEYRSITWCVRYGYPLEAKGLAKRTLLSDRSYLTPLGLAVRAYLKEQSHD